MIIIYFNTINLYFLSTYLYLYSLINISFSFYTIHLINTHILNTQLIISIQLIIYHPNYLYSILSCHIISHQVILYPNQVILYPNQVIFYPDLDFNIISLFYLYTNIFYDGSSFKLNYLDIDLLLLNPLFYYYTYTFSSIYYGYITF